MDAHAWDERYAAADQVWSVGPNQFVAASLGDLPPGAAVDLACGEGRNALWLAAGGWTVTAVDFSAVAVERGRRRAAELGPPVEGRVDWRVGDVLVAALPRCDLALLSYLQLPADERRTAVRRAFDALARGGTLFVVAHDSTNLLEGSGGPQDPEVLFTAQDVLGDLAGLPHEVVRAGRMTRVVEADAHRGTAGATAYDAMVHVRRIG